MSDVTHWQLRRGGDILANLTSYGASFPWTDCDFEPTAAFADYRALFTEEFTLLNPHSDEAQNWVEWEAAYDKIAQLGIAFVPVDDAAYALMQDLLAREDERPWISAILRAE